MTCHAQDLKLDIQNLRYNYALRFVSLRGIHGLGTICQILFLKRHMPVSGQLTYKSQKITPCHFYHTYTWHRLCCCFAFKQHVTTHNVQVRISAAVTA